MNNSKDIDVLLKSLKSLIEDQEVGSVSPAERLTLTINDLAIKENENIEVVFRRKDGSQLLGMMSARNIVLQGVPHIISVTHDITTRRQAEEEILYLSYHD
jgi:PAS domain S-box